jgi:predicted transcriptional regulator
MKNKDLFECHEMIKISIPSIRYALARILYKNYNFSQKKISDSLGITQAAVSKYLSHNCSKAIIETGNDKRFVKVAGILAKKISMGKISTDELKSEIDKSAILLLKQEKTGKI